MENEWEEPRFLLALSTLNFSSAPSSEMLLTGAPVSLESTEARISSLFDLNAGFGEEKEVEFRIARHRNCERGISYALAILCMSNEALSRLRNHRGSVGDRSSS